eukprot:CAMPEP_0179179834 /NCGR_PEP_ID=MMETSP0796-20121207/89006_1 /TAXON_ID=73915 /ORGANISM="Pyrodinium bahamense, Strain pbaha01" /LENGTH=35 /DNA_ID= /DNA_START= /DNA_END= /DNA_ORIENTATION=
MCSTPTAAPCNVHGLAEPISAAQKLQGSHMLDALL